MLANEDNLLRINLSIWNLLSERMLALNPEVEILLRFQVSEHKFTCRDLDLDTAQVCVQTLEGKELSSLCVLS